MKNFDIKETKKEVIGIIKEALTEYKHEQFIGDIYFLDTCNVEIVDFNDKGECNIKIYPKEICISFIVE